MTCEERLNRVRNTYEEAKRLALKVEELESIATKMTPVLSLTPRSDGYALKDDTWAKYIDYKMQCEEKISDYITSCMELDNELDCIRNRSIRTAMKYYYVDRLKQETIAERMHYSDREIRYLLSKGRKIYYEEYND